MPSTTTTIVYASLGPELKVFELDTTTGALTLSDDFGSTNDAVVDVINLGTVP